MLVLWIILWIGGIMLLIADSKKESTKWASAIAFFGGTGGLSVIFREDIYPYFNQVYLNESLSLFLLIFTNLLSFISHYLTPYAFFMFSISYSGLLPPKWKKRLMWIY